MNIKNFTGDEFERLQKIQSAISSNQQATELVKEVKVIYGGLLKKINNTEQNIHNVLESWNELPKLFEIQGSLMSFEVFKQEKDFFSIDELNNLLLKAKRESLNKEEGENLVGLINIFVNYL
jgi:hypothetical protein